jgi:acyl-coenzyme A thioesterase PaaI-like protein
MTSRRGAQKLLDFLKVQSHVEKSPSFSGALGLNHESVSASQVSFDSDKQNLTFRLPITQRIRLPRQDDTVALSTYLAIIDDVTTWALILGDAERSRPGVSISLRGEWAKKNGHYPSEEVDISASISKIGRNVGFVRAEVRDTATGHPICFASHIKYLPMGAFVDMMMSSYGWNAAKLYTEHFISSPNPGDSPPLADLFESLQFVSDNRATFERSSVHASLGGPIHGGCQAVLMELVASEVAKRELGAAIVRLDSMHVEYISAPSSKTVEVDVQVESKDEAKSSVTLRVQLLGGGKTKSEGTLRFSPVLASQSKL